MVKYLSHLRIGILLFLMIAGFYWKLTLTRQFDWLWGPDLANQILPWFQVQARQWHEGQFPLWDPYLWAGQPLLGQAQPGAAYPLNWLLFWIPLEGQRIQMIALQWYFVIIHFMAAVFGYALCRDLQRSVLASLTGGLIFSLACYVGTTYWPQMLNGAIWAPLVLLFLIRAVEGRRPLASAALSGTCLGLAWLSGHHQSPMLITVAAAGTWLYFILRRVRPDWRVLGTAAVALVFMVATSALQLLPALEYGRLAKRWVGAADALAWNQPVPYYVHHNYDLKAVNLFGIVFPGIRSSFDPYVGIVALSLALIAIAVLWEHPRVRLFSALAIAGLVYALGHYSVFQGFLYSVVPGLEKARSPSAAVLLFGLGIAVLASFGVDSLSPSPASPWPRRVLLATLGFGVLTVLIFEAVLFANKLTYTADDRVLITALVAILMAALLFAWIRGNLTRRQAGSLLVLLLLLELGNNSGYSVADRADKDRTLWMDQMQANADIAEYLKKQPGYYRADIAENAFAANWGAWHGVQMWGGGLASTTSNLMDFEFHTTQAKLLYGVAHTLASKPTVDGQQEAFTGRSGLKVFRNPAVFPRAWAVHEIVPVPHRRAGNSLIMQRLEELRSKAFIVGTPPRLDSCGGADHVVLARHDEAGVAIRADMACAGLVVLSDTFFPGWRAYIDGAPARIYEVNGAMRGVVVPQGRHLITMRYRPLSVFAGAALSLLGIIGAALITVVHRSGGRKPSDA